MKAPSVQMPIAAIAKATNESARTQRVMDDAGLDGETGSAIDSPSTGATGSLAYWPRSET